MFRSATAAKRALSRRASLVESSEQVRIETAILTELKKGLFSISEAMVARDDDDRAAAKLDATAAYENATHMLNASPFPITESTIQEKLRKLQSAIGSYLVVAR